jgi:hypothetical protein
MRIILLVLALSVGFSLGRITNPERMITNELYDQIRVLRVMYSELEAKTSQCVNGVRYAKF